MKELTFLLLLLTIFIIGGRRILASTARAETLIDPLIDPQSLSVFPFKANETETAGLRFVAIAILRGVVDSVTTGIAAWVFGRNEVPILVNDLVHVVGVDEAVGVNFWFSLDRLLGFQSLSFDLAKVNHTLAPDFFNV